MNWRQESSHYQQEQSYREDFARDEITGIKERRNHNAIWLIWAVGPTMLNLPGMLPKQPNVTYTIDYGPINATLDSAPCIDDLAAKYPDRQEHIDTRLKYEPFVTLTGTWIGPKYDTHRLRFGVISCVEYDTTDQSTQLALVSPNYDKTRLARYESLPYDLEIRGCTIVLPKGTRSRKERMVAFPTPTNFTTAEYMKTKAAVEYALRWVLDKTAIQFAPPDGKTKPLHISREKLEMYVDTLHPPNAPIHMQSV